MGNSVLSKAVTGLCESFPLFIFVSLGYLVLSQATNIPFWDEWGMANVFDRYYAGTLTLSYFFTGQTEHVLAIPQLIILLLGLLTQWDLRMELPVNLAAGLGTYLLYRCVLLRETNDDDKNKILLLPLIGVLVFSFIQWHNWIWGWQMQIFISMLAGLSSLAILATHELTTKKIFIAACCAVIANLSFASGSTLWFIGLVLIALRSNKASHYLLWCLAASPCLYLYYLIKPDDLVLDHIDVIAHLQYIVTYIGNPVTPRQWGIQAGFYTGLLGLCFPVIYLLIYRKPKNYTLFALAVIAHVILVAALTGIGRPLDNLVDETNASRYTTVAIHYWIAVIFLLYHLFRHPAVFIKIPACTLMVAITVLSIFISSQSIHHFYVKDERTRIITYLRYPYLVAVDKVNFNAVIWSKGLLNRQTALMKKHHLSFYAPYVP